MEFDIKCVAQKAMKGQALADILASHPRWPVEEKTDGNAMVMSIHKTHPWTLYFDGAAVGQGGGAGPRGGAGVVLMEPSGELHLHAFCNIPPGSPGEPDRI